MRLFWISVSLLIPLTFVVPVSSQSFVNSVANTGSNQQTSTNDRQSLTTGDASAKSEITNNNGQVSGHLEVEVNGTKKTIEVTGSGNFKLEINQSGTNVQTETKATGEAQKKIVKKQNTTKSILSQILEFFLQLFKK